MPEQKSVIIETRFPIGGFVENVSHRQQPPSTYAEGSNVLPFDSIEDRARGGQRSGTSKYLAAAVNGTNFIQRIDRTVEFISPGTVQIVDIQGEDNFNFGDGFVSSRSSALWLEFQGATAVGAGPAYPGSIVATQADCRDCRFIVSSSQVTVDWTSDANTGAFPDSPWPSGDQATTTDNQYRLLEQQGSSIDRRVYPPDVANPAGSFTSAIIRMKVITSSSGETAGQYMWGIIFRLDSPATNDFFVVGWRKPSGGNTQEIALIDDTGANVATVRTITAPSTTPDDLAHTLELRINGDIIQVFWDGVNLTPGGADTYDLSGDGLDTVAHNRVGIYHHRLRTSGSWSNAVVGAADDWQFFEAEESPGLRSEKLLIVSAGDVFTGDVQSGVNLAIAGDNQLSATSRFISSVFAFQNVYLLDGFSYHRYVLSTNTVGSWSADGATPVLPGGDAGPDIPNVVRGTMIVLWQGRLVISGLASDQANVFFSAIGLPDDWDFAAPGGDAGDAVNLGSSLVLGEVGDIVSALIPDRGTRLIIGGVNTINILRGNPAITEVSSPQFPVILTVSKTIGMAGGSRAWAFSPDGTVFFWGPDGLYSLPPLVEQQATSLSAANKVSSGRLDKTFGQIDLSTNQIQMLWDTDADGLWIFVTPIDTALAGRHYFFDRRTGGFHPFELPFNQGPTAILSFQSDKPSTTAFMLGGSDSFLRKWNQEAKDDDGIAIPSSVLVGPILSPFPGREMRISQIIATVAEGSDTLQFSIQVGDTAEAAKSALAAFSGTWSAGLNPSVLDRARGGAAYIKLSNTTANQQWAIESILATLTAAGPIRPR